MKDFKPGDIVYYATCNGVGTAKLQKCRVEHLSSVNNKLVYLQVLEVVIGEMEQGQEDRLLFVFSGLLSPTLKDGISGLVESIECRRQSILASIGVLQEQCEALEKEKAFVAMFEDEKELING